MHWNRFNWICATAGASLLVTCCGCSPSTTPTHSAASPSRQATSSQQGEPAQDDEHAHHDHAHEHGEHEEKRPTSFAAGVNELGPLVRQIQSACQSGDLESAHGALHDVGSLLPKLPELAADSDLSKPEWEQVKKASDRLFEIFSDIDASMHTPAGKSDSSDGLAAAADEAGTLLKSLEDLSKKSVEHAEGA
ncbi:MAG: hypothetical protein U0795_06475 [Pirellulales bacterium]